MTEIIAVVATGFGKLLFVNVLNWKLFYILTTIIFWTIYVIVKSRKEKGILRYWGFRKENFWPTFQPLFTYGLVAFLVFFLYGKHMGYLTHHWHFFAILLIYPIWGLIQQFLIMSLLGGNLKDSNKIHWKDGVIIFVTAFMFSIVHLPVIELVLATFLLATIYAFLFLKYRNLWPLGLFHGWLGAVFYYFVLNRDPWDEMFLGYL